MSDTMHLMPLPTQLHVCQSFFPMDDSNPGETIRPRDFVTGSAATGPHGSLLRLLLRIMRGQLVAS